MTIAFPESAETLPEKFSLLTAMMDTVPGIFVDGVLSNLKFRDVFNFRCASHRCQDVVLSNFNRLKKSTDVTVLIQWANNEKRLMFGNDHYLLCPSKNARFVIVDTEDAATQKVSESIEEWRENSVLFTKKPSHVEVRKIGNEDVNLVAFLLNKCLPQMSFDALRVDGFDRHDFALLAKKHLHISIKKVYVDEDCEGPYFVSSGLPYFQGDARNVPFASIQSLIDCTNPHELLVRSYRSYFDAFPKSFFMSPNLKDIRELYLDGPWKESTAEFDDELLLSSFPKLRVLEIGQCDVTTTGLNTFLKQFIAGVRDFESIELTFRHQNGWIDEDAVWMELVVGIPWPDHSIPFHLERSSRDLKMLFMDDWWWHPRSVRFFVEASTSNRVEENPPPGNPEDGDSDHYEDFDFAELDDGSDDMRRLLHGR